MSRMMRLIQQFSDDQKEEIAKTQLEKGQESLIRTPEERIDESKLEMPAEKVEEARAPVSAEELRKMGRPERLRYEDRKLSDESITDIAQTGVPIIPSRGQFNREETLIDSGNLKLKQGKPLTREERTARMFSGRQKFTPANKPDTLAMLPQDPLSKLRAKELAEQGNLYAGVSRLANVDEITELGKQQLITEASEVIDADLLSPFAKTIDNMMVGNYNRSNQIYDNSGTSKFEKLIELGAASTDIDNSKLHLFGTKLDTSDLDQDVLDTDPHALLKQNADVISYLIKDFEKLDMLTDRGNPASKVRPEFGAGAMIATLTELGARRNEQAAEIDKPADKRRYDRAMDRTEIGPAIGRRLERLMYPTQQDDTTKRFLGETEGFGYKYRLTPEEQSILGQTIIQGFANSPIFPWLETDTIQSTDPDKQEKITFRVTESGERNIRQMRRVLKQLLGIDTKDRKVSVVSLSKGKLRGEGAYTQKQITKQPSKNYLTPVVEEAVDILGKVYHTVSPHKALLKAGMLAAAKKDNEGVFAKYTKQSISYRNDKANEIYQKYITRMQSAEEQYTPEKHGYTREEGESMAEAFATIADNEALDIQMDHLNLQEETLLDAVRLGLTPFAYGWSVINNSSRLMISNDELNYQLNKDARFMVDGAKNNIFKKTDMDLNAFKNKVNQLKENEYLKGEAGFMLTLARSLVPDADKLSLDEMMDTFFRNKDQYIKYGNQLLDYTTANESRFFSLQRGLKSFENQEFDANNPQNEDQQFIYNLTQPLVEGVKRQKNPQIQTGHSRLYAPLDIDSTFEKFLNEHDKNTYYFAMDAAHELARYNKFSGDQFSTRVKAEADGNSNGAVIQGFQIGDQNMLEKGGALYQIDMSNIDPTIPLTDEQVKAAESFEEDIRDDILDHIIDAEVDFIIDEDVKDNWKEIFLQVKAKGLTKDLLKNPIMTSIYGKDPRFHEGVASKFVDSNPDIFNSATSNLTLEISDIKLQLTDYIQAGLERGLGGALEHARVIKKASKLAVMSNKLFAIPSQNGFMIQSGGTKYTDKSTVKVELGEGARQYPIGDPRNRNALIIETSKKEFSAAARAGARRVESGEVTNPKTGSKLENQSAVNGTQGLDASIQQKTTIDFAKLNKDSDILPTHMHVFDAFIGDSDTYNQVVSLANKNFIDINMKYNLVEQEYLAIKKIYDKTIAETKAKEKLPDTDPTKFYDIGREGKHAGMGDIINRSSAIVNTFLYDFNDAENTPTLRDRAKRRLKGLYSRIKNVPGKEYDPTVNKFLIRPALFRELYEKINKDLNALSDLKELYIKVEQKKKEVAKRIAKESDLERGSGPMQRKLGRREGQYR